MQSQYTMHDKSGQSEGLTFFKTNWKIIEFDEQEELTNLTKND